MLRVDTSIRVRRRFYHEGADKAQIGPNPAKGRPWKSARGASTIREQGRDSGERLSRHAGDFSQSRRDHHLVVNEVRATGTTQQEIRAVRPTSQRAIQRSLGDLLLRNAVAERTREVRDELLGSVGRWPFVAPYRSCCHPPGIGSGII
jgi:hypothetical protein